jgi:hypothetical protein
LGSEVLRWTTFGGFGRRALIWCKISKSLVDGRLVDPEKAILSNIEVEHDRVSVLAG